MFGSLGGPFRNPFLTDLSLRQLNYGKFPSIDTESTDVFLEAISLAYTYAEFKDWFVSKGLESTAHTYMVLIAELLPPGLISANSSPENTARAYFSTVMKYALRTRSYSFVYSRTRLTSEVYESLPAFGKPSNRSILGTPITRLKNFKKLPTGKEDHLTFENLYHYLILCVHHHTMKPLEMKVRAVATFLSAFVPMANLTYFNRVVCEETGVDPNLNFLEVGSLRVFFAIPLEEKNDLSCVKKWTALLHNFSPRLKTVFLHVRLRYYHEIKLAILKYKDFPWAKVVQMIPDDCVAFLQVRDAVRSAVRDDEFNVFRKDMGFADVKNYQFLSYLASKLLEKKRQEKNEHVKTVRDTDASASEEDRIRTDLDGIVAQYFSQESENSKDTGSNSKNKCSKEESQVKEELQKKQLLEDVESLTSDLKNLYLKMLNKE